MYKLKAYTCLNCDKEFASRKWRQKYCSMSCSSLAHWKKAKAAGKNFNGGPLISTVPFMKMKDLSKNEVYRNARKVYLVKNPELCCKQCGIDDPDVIDIAHIKAVSEFSKETLLLEINQISNLTALCKNCHWKFDMHLAGKKGQKKKALTAT